MFSFLSAINSKDVFIINMLYCTNGLPSMLNIWVIACNILDN